MNKNEMKNRISMALKDPILQQGFEIICKNLADLEKENTELQEKFAVAEARLKYLNEFHTNCVEAFVSQSPRDDYEMACSGREIFELLYPDDERLKDIYK